MVGSYKIRSDAVSDWWTWVVPGMDKSIAKCNYSNIFDNVKDLVLWIRAIKNELLYSANVISLTIACSSDDARQNYLSIEHVKYLNTLVNVSNIKHLTIENTTLKKK
jgi:hypothetical protein